MEKKVVYFDKFCPLCNVNHCSDSESGETFFCATCGTKLIYQKDFMKDAGEIGFAESFDNMASDMMVARLKLNTNMCLAERYQNWILCYGFIEAHLLWFEQLKKKGGCQDGAASQIK